MLGLTDSGQNFSQSSGVRRRLSPLPSVRERDGQLESGGGTDTGVRDEDGGLRLETPSVNLLKRDD